MVQSGQSYELFCPNARAYETGIRMVTNTKKALFHDWKSALILWEQRESNPRPSACKADALNQLSYAPETGLQMYDDFLNMQTFLTKILRFYAK